MQRRMLTKEEEASAEDKEVRREDQDKINKFSRLHQKDLILKDELKAKNKEKEELEELSSELELADEEELVRYKIGGSFFHITLSDAQELLTTKTEAVDRELGHLESKIESIQEEMSDLKVALYARFGKSINLES